MKGNPLVQRVLAGCRAVREFWASIDDDDARKMLLIYLGTFVGTLAGGIFAGIEFGWNGVIWGMLLGGWLSWRLMIRMLVDLDDEYDEYDEHGHDDYGVDDELEDGGFSAAPRPANDYGMDRTDTLFRVTFMTAGHVTKADGRVTDEELQGIHDVVEYFAQGGMDQEQCEEAIWLFHAGVRGNTVPNGFDLDDALQVLAREARADPEVAANFMDIVIAMACAGQRLPEEKAAVLEHCRAAMDYPEHIFKGRVDWHLHDKYQGGQPPPMTAEEGLDWAYALLEIESSASASDVRSAYARKMKEIHPDKLAAKELPQVLTDFATVRTREIMRAYQAIRQAHGETVTTEEDGQP